MEEKKKINEKTLEIIVAIFLGITALLTAWASWVGSLHGGNQATNYTKSNNTSADGNSRWNEAAQNVMQDMLLWNEIGDLQLDILYAQDKNDEATLEISCFKLYTKCNENLTDAMANKIGYDMDAAAEADDVTEFIIAWLDKDEAVTSPFASEEYVESYYEEAAAVIEESEEILKQGQKDNSNGDKYGLVTVIYSVVLFLLGIAGTFKNIPNRFAIVIISIVIFILATILMIRIPLPTGFSLKSFF